MPKFLFKEVLHSGVALIGPAELYAGSSV